MMAGGPGAAIDSPQPRRSMRPIVGMRPCNLPRVAEGRQAPCAAAERPAGAAPRPSGIPCTWPRNAS